MPRPPLALALLVALGAGAAPVIEESFESNVHGWRLDGQWRLADGRLTAEGLAGQVLAVFGDLPETADLRATLIARAIATPAEGSWGFGLLYRFDPRARNGYMAVIGADGGYGFGRVTEGRFALEARGTSALVKAREARRLTLEVKGDRHLLRIDDALVDVWRDNARDRGLVGLVVFEAVTVEFEELTLEALGEPVRRPALLGPLPPGAEPPASEAPRPALFGPADLELARQWRRRWNRLALELGLAALPAELDVVDLAVLALLKDRHVTGLGAPARVLVEWFGLRSFIDAGAVGPGPEAALEFWLAWRSEPERPEEVGAQADLLADLTWYQAVRARVTAGWGDRARYPLVVDNTRQSRLDHDWRRFERASGETVVAERGRDWAALAEQVLRAAATLTAREAMK